MKMFFAPASKPAWTSAAALLALMTATGRASIVGPYSPDSNTLHLWHLNESAVPALDAVTTGGTNLTALGGGATLGNSSYSGFGTALNTYGPGPNYTGACSLSPQALPNDYTALTYVDPVTGAFTYEALVKVTYDPNTNLGAAPGGTGRNKPLTFISAEGNTGYNGARIFAFRLDPIGFDPDGGGPLPVQTQPALEFINLNKGTSVQNIVMPVPTYGPDAIALNGWYHVAVTYSGQPGTADNLKFYWTRMDPNCTSASLIGSATMNLNLVAGAAPNFVIGNTGRAPTGDATKSVDSNFLGLIDEVRMSKVARSAGQMMFAAPSITLDVDLTNQVTVLGQSVSFAVSAAGVPPLRYQWRHDNVNILNATQAVYTIPAVAAKDVGNYDVVITNDYSTVVSSVANLSLRTPLHLSWVGSGSPWDVGTSYAWVDGNSQSTTYTEGDSVTFDNQGMYSPQVTLAGPVWPSAVVVNADSDYTFNTLGGGISGMTGLTKQGTGNLILDLNNGYSGPTLINGGAIQLGAASARGSLGTGPITNNTGLIFNRSDAFTINNLIAGPGSLTNNGAGTVTLQGTNLCTGTVAVNAGALMLGGAQALGSCTNFVLTASPGSGGITGTWLGLAGGLATGTNVALYLLKSFSSPDLRCNLYTDSGTNAWNGPIFLDNGDGLLALAVNATDAQLNVNGPISSPDFIGKLTLRGGGGRGVLNGQVNLPFGQVNKTESSVWTITSTGNTWLSTDIAGGTLRLGANNALPTGVTVNLTNQTAGTLDLGGFNQQIAGLNGANTSSVIGSSSTTADSVLTLNTTGVWTNWAVIQDSLSGGTRKVGLTLSGGSLTLTAANTYSGKTVVNAGTLALVGAGAFANSSVIYLGSGATLDVSARTGAGLTLGANQTLQGDGAFNVLGNLTNAGTVELKVTRAGATPAFDQVQASGQITYGGNLKLNCSGALAAGDALKLFQAAGYSGAFATLSPASPGPGLAWYTGTMATDGTLRVISIPHFASTGSTINESESTMTVHGSGGPPLLSFVVVTTGQGITNPVALWTPLQTNTFDANGNCTFSLPLRTTRVQQYFRIRIP